MKKSKGIVFEGVSGNLNSLTRCEYKLSHLLVLIQNIFWCPVKFQTEKLLPKNIGSEKSNESSPFQRTPSTYYTPWTFTGFRFFWGSLVGYTWKNSQTHVPLTWWNCYFCGGFYVWTSWTTLENNGWTWLAPKNIGHSAPWCFGHRNAGSKRWRKWLRRPSVVSSDRHCVVPWGCCEFQGEISPWIFPWLPVWCLLTWFIFRRITWQKGSVGSNRFQWMVVKFKNNMIPIPDTSMIKYNQNQSISYNPTPCDLHFDMLYLHIIDTQTRYTNACQRPSALGRDECGKG